MPIRNKTSLVVDEMLRVIAIAGVAAMVVTAPNGLVALEKPLKKLSKRLDKDIDARKLAYYIRRVGIVEVKECEDGKYEVALTDRGRKRLAKMDFESMSIGIPRKWDGKWRMVIFDIPEEFKAQRWFLTQKLSLLGFRMMQKSMWVHPFPCREQIELIKHVVPEIADDVAFIEAEYTDKHNDLIKKFTNILPF